MEESLYNFFVPNKDRIICFNAISGKVFSVNKEEYTFINQILKNPSKNDDELKKFLIDSKFIVEDNNLEINAIIIKNRKMVFDNVYQLIINPTLECNFNCWYCYEKKIKGHMNREVFDNIKKFINNLVVNHEIRGLNLSWFGGEPLMYYKSIIKPISLYAKNLMNKKDLIFSNTITTNGYLMNDDMIKDFVDIGLNHFQITLDGGKDTHDKTRNQNGKPSFDKIVNNIINLIRLNSKSKVRLRINYTNEIIKEDFQEILNVFPQDVRERIYVDFQRVWQTANEVKEQGKNNPDLIKGIEIAQKLNFIPVMDKWYSLGKCYQCYVDRFYYAHINFDGKVYKCTARNYSEKFVCGELTDEGRIIWKPGILEKMHTRANFENEKCLKCKLLPLCIGPCYQNYLDYKNKERDGFCIYGGKEVNVEYFIKDYYRRVKLYNNSL